MHVVLLTKAQSLQDSCTLKVHLLDNDTKEDVPFANIVVYQNGVQVSVATSDLNGIGNFKNLKQGLYDIKGVYVGYAPQEIKKVMIISKTDNTLTIALKSDGGLISCCEIICCCGYYYHDDTGNWWPKLWTPYREWYKAWKEKKQTKPQNNIIVRGQRKVKQQVEEKEETIDTINRIYENNEVNAINKPLANDEVKIYPNPCSGVLHVDFVQKVKIISADGKVIHEAITEEPVEINVNGFANGIYYLNYEKNGKQATKEIIVLK